MTSTTTPESRGQLAYTAYGKRLGFVHPDGTRMEQWHLLPEMTREAWMKAANLIWDLAKTGRAVL